MSTPTKPFTVGYLIPEFPGQTHIWMWREIVHLKEWGVGIELFSTRRPGEQVRARHAFAEKAARETCYLWPASAGALVGALLWAIFLQPVALLRCVLLALTLPLDGSLPWLKAAKLIPPGILLARAAQARGVDHLHCHTCAAGAVLAMYARIFSGIPYSMTLNADVDIWGGALREKIQQSAFTVAITGKLLEDARALAPGLPATQIILGRIGVDTRHWVPSPQASESTTGPFRLVTVGRLNKSKGHDILLRAVKKLSDKGVPITLRLIGAGPEREALEMLRDELKLKDVAQFLGSLAEDQVIAQMRQSDAFALASNAEPLGVVYMEAMAMEVTTIGTAAGGVGEIITDGQDGLLVPPRNHDALADAIERLQRDPALRRRLAIAGRRKIIRDFDSRVGARTLYERLLGPLPEAIVRTLPSVTESQAAMPEQTGAPQLR